MLNLQLKKKEDQKLPFLDVLITKTSQNKITTNYKKTTDTDLLTHYLSFIPTRYKLGLVKTFEKHMVCFSQWNREN